MAGAAAIQVGAALFRDPFAPLKIIDGLQAFADQQGLKSITELTGSVQEW
jgi:dihydroorotate dehydrogenase (NAD+) catalytic subunit